MPIIARLNTKQLDIFDNALFTIKRINAKSVSIIADNANRRIIHVLIALSPNKTLVYTAYCITIGVQSQSHRSPFGSP